MIILCYNRLFRVKYEERKKKKDKFENQVTTKKIIYAFKCGYYCYIL